MSCSGADIDTALESAWRFLSRQARSVAEVREHLARENFSRGTIAHTLKELSRDGYLDDYQLGCDLLRLARARGWGSYRAMGKLQARGLTAEVIERCLAEGWDTEAEMAAALEAARKRLAALGRRESTMWPRVARFLQGRGFPSEVIKKVRAQLLLPSAPGEPE
ncbi:MAG: hypothetical protein D9V47_06125 [Clostridia bacterium]|nr:MAG: hypothetical protein D9V47_06125 [Clostridia bacterium]